VPWYELRPLCCGFFNLGFQLSGCTNPARIQAPLASVVVTIGANAVSASVLSLYGAQFTFPRIVVGNALQISKKPSNLYVLPGITEAAIIALVATTSSTTPLSFTVTVDASFSSLKVAVSHSYTMPAASGSLDCTRECSMGLF
jgi:hypothetical protein